MIEFLESTVNRGFYLASKTELTQIESNIMKQWTNAFIDYNHHHDGKLTMANKEEFIQVLEWKRSN